MFMKFLFIMYMISIKSTDFSDKNHQSSLSKYQNIMLTLIKLKQQASQLKLEIERDLDACILKRNEIFDEYKRSFSSDFFFKNYLNDRFKKYKNKIFKYELQLKEINTMIISINTQIHETQTRIDDIYNMKNELF